MWWLAMRGDGPRVDFRAMVRKWALFGRQTSGMRGGGTPPTARPFEPRSKRPGQRGAHRKQDARTHLGSRADLPTKRVLRTIHPVDAHGPPQQSPAFRITRKAGLRTRTVWLSGLEEGLGRPNPKNLAKDISLDTAPDFSGPFRRLCYAPTMASRAASPTRRP